MPDKSWRRKLQRHNPTNRANGVKSHGIAEDFIVGQGPTFVGGLGMGASFMYFLDSHRGRARRSLARNKVVHATKKGRSTASVTRSDVMNRARGLVAEASSRLSAEEIDEEVLVERVRSKLGRLVSHPSSIEIKSDEGRVTISGPVLSSEVTGLIRGIAAVKGVKAVDDRLDEYDEPADVPGLQGQGSRPIRFAKVNWSPTTRFVGGLAGTALASQALIRRDGIGNAAGIAGTALLARSITNLPIKRLVGAGAGRRGIDVQKSLNISAPVEKVFEFLTDYESFPSFMAHVRDVKNLGQNRSRWVIDGPGRIPLRFDAEVSAFNRNERFGWRSAPGSAIEHSGVFEFQPNADGSTRVQMRMTYNPIVGGVGHVVAKLVGADPKKQVDDDLLRMKSFIETGRRPSDAAQPASKDRASTEKEEGRSITRPPGRKGVSREASEGDAAEASRTWTEQEEVEEAPEVPVDVPAPDADEQSKPWAQEEAPSLPEIPPDAPEGDALDQSRPAQLDEDGERD